MNPKRHPGRRGRVAGDGGQNGLVTRVFRISSHRWRWSLQSFYGTTMDRGSVLGTRRQAFDYANTRKEQLLHGK